MAIIKTAEATYVAARTMTGTGANELKTTINKTNWTSSAVSGKIGMTKNASKLADSMHHMFNIKFTTPTWPASGACKNLSVKLKMKSTAFTTIKLLCRIYPEANADYTTYWKPYYSAGTVYSSGYNSVGGAIVDITGLSSAANYVTINIDTTDLERNTTYALYIGAYEYGYRTESSLPGSYVDLCNLQTYTYWYCADIVDLNDATATITVTYEMPYSAAQIRTGSSCVAAHPHIYINGEWVQVSPYVYADGAWQECDS